MCTCFLLFWWSSWPLVVAPKPQHFNFNDAQCVSFFHSCFYFRYPVSQGIKIIPPESFTVLVWRWETSWVCCNVYCGAVQFCVVPGTICWNAKIKARSWLRVTGGKQLTTDVWVYLEARSSISSAFVSIFTATPQSLAHPLRVPFKMGVRILQFPLFSSWLWKPHALVVPCEFQNQFVSFWNITPLDSMRSLLQFCVVPLTTTSVLPYLVLTSQFWLDFHLLSPVAAHVTYQSFFCYFYLRFSKWEVLFKCVSVSIWLYECVDVCICVCGGMCLCGTGDWIPGLVHVWRVSYHSHSSPKKH